MKVQEFTKENNEYFKVSFDLKNTGKLKGAEVVQLYVSAIDPKIERAPKELKAFRKISLRSGETSRVEFNINKNAFSYYDTDTKQWVTDPGKYEILLGNSSRDIKLKEAISIK